MNQLRTWASRNLWVVGVAGLCFGGLVALSSGAVGGATAFSLLGKRAPAIAAPPAAKFFDVTVDGIAFVNTDFTTVSPIVSHTSGTQTTYEPMLITRHYGGPDELTAWRQRVVAGAAARLERRNVKITYFDATLRPMRTVMLEDAWPSGWQTPPMDVNLGGAGPEVMRFTFTRATNR
jgi:hypothetical protein